MKMKIAVVDLISIDGGGYHITNNLYAYVSAGNCRSHSWLFIVSEQDFKSNEYVTVKHIGKSSMGYIKRAKTEYVDVNRELNRYGVDIVIAMSNMRILGCSRDQVVYMQQSIPFQKAKRFSFFVPAERNYAFRQYIQGFLIKQSLKKAKGILVQTNWVERAVKEAIKKDNVKCIGYPGQNEQNKRADMSFDLKKDFFYPCGPELYKNLFVVVRAVNCLKEQGYSFRFYLTLTKKELTDLVGEEISDDIFICMGRILPEAVQEMYTRTTLVFASYIETVGLPLVEAKNAGTWVIASDCEFSHEVLDEYPNKTYFDPYNYDSLAQQMKKVLRGEEIIIVANSKKPVKHSCWDEMTNYITELYQH